MRAVDTDQLNHVGSLEADAAARLYLLSKVLHSKGGIRLCKVKYRHNDFDICLSIWMCYNETDTDLPNSSSSI